MVFAHAILHVEHIRIYKVNVFIIGAVFRTPKLEILRKWGGGAKFQSQKKFFFFLMGFCCPGI